METANRLSKKTGITVEELLEFLQKKIQENPSLKEAKIHFVEFGGLEKAMNVSIEDNMVVIE